VSKKKNCTLIITSSYHHPIPLKLPLESVLKLVTIHLIALYPINFSKRESLLSLAIRKIHEFIGHYDFKKEAFIELELKKITKNITPSSDPDESLDNLYLRHLSPKISNPNNSSQIEPENLKNAADDEKGEIADLINTPFSINFASNLFLYRIDKRRAEELQMSSFDIKDKIRNRAMNR